MNSIYRLTNTVNNKVYIGKTVQHPAERLKQHMTSNSRLYIHCAIRKYQPAAFTFDIIFNTFIEKDLNEFERYFIVLHDCCMLDGSEKGYNMTRGGEGFDSEWSSRVQQKRIANGTFHWQGEQGSKAATTVNKRRVIENNNPFAGEWGSKIQQVKVANGTHHLQGESGRAIQRDRLLNGTHNWGGEVGSITSVKQNQLRIANGTHNALFDEQCPHCGKVGKGFVMHRWHFNNCKDKA